MKWYKIKIETDTEAVDILTYLLDEMGIEGAIVEDPNDPMFKQSFKGDWDYSEDNARTFDTESTVIKVFIEESMDITKAIIDIEGLLKKIKINGLNIGKGLITYEIVDDIDWKDKWKEYFKPFKIGSRIVIKPSWENYVEEKTDIIIEMDPGSAFGSGTHETTSMCVKLIEDVIDRVDSVYDIGCGTGILGLAASKLGATKVVGVDISEDAIIATKENIKKNNLEEIMSVKLGNLTDVISDKADLVVANIMADILILMTSTISNFVKTGGYYITSGIIDAKTDKVIEVLKTNKFEIIKHLNEGEWNAILARYVG